MGKFPSSFPEGCPSNAEEMKATLYHGCTNNPSTDQDFVPFAYSTDNKKRERAKRIGCNGWGISCWTSERTARHTQELFSWAAKWHIFKADVTPDDGKLAHTPSGNQAEHYTFWCYEGVQLRDRFTWAWPPHKGSAS